jgi:hypothetical protein
MHDCCNHVTQDDFEGDVPGTNDVVSLTRLGVSGRSRTSQER